MTQPIQLYYKTVLKEIVGREHGLDLAEIKALSPRIADLTRAMTRGREQGKLPYRDLPHRQGLRETVKQLVERLSGRFDNVVVLGIGGSALGNIALQTALNSPTQNWQGQPGAPRLFVVDNVDPVQFGSLLAWLTETGQLERTLFNVISKSGRTAETAAQWLTVQGLLTERLGRDKLAEHVIATTDAKAGTLRSIADSLGLTTLVVPDGVGGRFSVLSDVGLFSAAMCGVDIDALHAGARAMDGRVSSDDLMENPAALYAAIQYLYYQKGKPLSVMFPYSFQLKDLSDWFRQLWAESLGKQVDLLDNTVFVGPTPIKALGTTDQHSQVQLYREGPNDKVFTFLEVASFQREVTIGSAGEVAELSYLSGQPMSKLINSEKRGTEYALVQSQRPCLTVRFPEVSAHTVGQFIYFFEVATSYAGGLFNIDTYNQPAVELGKEATFALMGHSKYAALLADIEKTVSLDRRYLL